MPLAFPFRPDARGRAAQVWGDRHIRDMIEQVLFTVPGERVNRPDFGCGLLQLVFAPNSEALAAAVLALGAGVWGAAQVLLAALVVAATLEAVFGLCLGCRMFAVLMRAGVIPESVCKRCDDIWGTPRTAAPG